MSFSVKFNGRVHCSSVSNVQNKIFCLVLSRVFYYNPVKCLIVQSVLCCLVSNVLECVFVLKCLLLKVVLGLILSKFLSSLGSLVSNVLCVQCPMLSNKKMSVHLFIDMNLQILLLCFMSTHSHCLQISQIKEMSR